VRSNSGISPAAGRWGTEQNPSVDPDVVVQPRIESEDVRAKLQKGFLVIVAAQ
jgi:hypothetical protein